MISLYVIGFGPYVKVGIARNLADRLAALQTGAPEDLAVYAAYAVPADLGRKVEARAHALLADCRAKGEWFRVSGDTAAQAAVEAIREIVGTVFIAEPQERTKRRRERSPEELEAHYAAGGL
jgi:hypothetical protein